MKEIFTAIYSDPLSLFFFRLGVFMLAISPVLTAIVCLGVGIFEKFINFLGSFFILAGKIIKELGKKIQR